MKTITIHLIFLTILTCFIFGCSKEKDTFTENEINEINEITGEWIWQESSGGFFNVIMTPESENLVRKLIIDDFLYKEFINDSLILETKYDLEISEETLIGTSEKMLIRFEAGWTQAIIISDSELHLIDQCFDCGYHKYTRN